MRKLFFINMLLLANSIICLAQNSKTQKRFTLYGITESKHIRSLVISSPNSTTTSIKIIDNKFVFSGFVYEPSIYTIEIDKEHVAMSFFIEPGSNHIHIKEKTIKLIGSKLNSQRDNFTNYVDSTRNILISLSAKMSNLNPNTDSSQLKYLRNLNDSVSISYYNGLRKFIEIEPYSFFNLYLLSKHMKSLGIDYTTKILKLLSKDFSNYPTYLDIVKTINDMSKVKIGQQAFNFSLPNTTSEYYDIGKFNNKIILLDFWATWCGPCIKEFPYFQEISNKYQNNIELVFISVDRDKNQWNNYLKNHNLPGIHLLDEKMKKSDFLANLYGVSSIPSNYLIDANGKIIGINLHGRSLEDAIINALKQ